MRYDPQNDKIRYEITHHTKNEQLKVFVRRYSKGDQKIKLGPRVFTNRYGFPQYTRVGRLKLKEFSVIARMVDLLT